MRHVAGITDTVARQSCFAKRIRPGQERTVVVHQGNFVVTHQPGKVSDEVASFSENCSYILQRFGQLEVGVSRFAAYQAYFIT
jgi:hypothetical protein